MFVRNLSSCFNSYSKTKANFKRNEQNFFIIRDRRVFSGYQEEAVVIVYF